MQQLFLYKYLYRSLLFYKSHLIPSLPNVSLTCLIHVNFCVICNLSLTLIDTCYENFKKWRTNCIQKAWNIFFLGRSTQNLKHTVVDYENNSDKLDIGHCLIKVKVMVQLKNSSPVTTIHEQNSRVLYLSLANSRKLRISISVPLKIIYNIHEYSLYCHAWVILWTVRDLSMLKDIYETLDHVRKL